MCYNWQGVQSEKRVSFQALGNHFEENNVIRATVNTNRTVLVPLALSAASETNVVIGDGELWTKRSPHIPFSDFLSLSLKYLQVLPGTCEAGKASLSWACSHLTEIGSFQRNPTASQQESLGVAVEIAVLLLPDAKDVVVFSVSGPSLFLAESLTF